MSTDSTSAITTTSTSSTETSNKNTKLIFNDLGADTFLKLLIAELQNQDPLNPMENSEMVQQLNQIYQLQANMQLVGAFEALGMTQNVASAMSLLGKTVEGLAESGETVSGTVERVTFADGVTQLHIGSQMVPLENVTEVAISEEEG